MHNLKKIVQLLFLVSALLLSTSMAVDDPSSRKGWLRKLMQAFEEDGKGESIHERLLRANTKDYGKYDPTPALAKPPFKLIPN